MVSPIIASLFQKFPQSESRNPKPWRTSTNREIIGTFSWNNCPLNALLTCSLKENTGLVMLSSALIFLQPGKGKGVNLIWDRFNFIPYQNCSKSSWTYCCRNEYIPQVKKNKQVCYAWCAEPMLNQQGTGKSI